jgi:hypothetical protein
MSVAGKGGRPVGLPKTGGRKKGTPNKVTLAVAEELSAIACNPIQILARIAMDETQETGHRIRALIELCSYLYPKRAPMVDLPPTDATVEVKTVVEQAPVPPNRTDSDHAHNSTEA